MAKLFTFEVHTPYRLFFTGPVEAVTLTLLDGEIGVLADHTFFTAPVLTGLLKIKDQEGRWKTAFTAEGVLEVAGHRTVLMVDAAEWPEEIDRDRALAAKQRAEEQLAAGTFKFEIDTARANLKRAEVRLTVAEIKQ
jgi:F-type H+-transporting ATPase subunit epsilon